MNSLRIIIAEANLPADGHSAEIALQALADRLRTALRTGASMSVDAPVTGSGDTAADREFAWKTLRGMY
jgi:hypothetical protein